MNQNTNNDLSKPIDFNMADLARETEKIDKYNETHHKDKPKSFVPSELPVINIGQQEKNQIDLKYIYDLIDKSSRKNKALKKIKKIKPKDVVMAATVALSVTSICAAFAVFMEKKINESVREREFQAAIEYMNENYMDEVYFNSGFGIMPDEKGNPVYTFDRSNYIRAVDYMMGLGFTKDEAELTLGKALNYDSRIYPEDMTPDEYYGSKLELKKDVRDNYDKYINNMKLYLDAHEPEVIDKVNKIKEEGPRNNARS